MFKWLSIDWHPDQNDANHSTIERGFWLCFMDDYNRAMQSFLHRWGNMEEHTFRHILLDTEKHDDDTLVAICVLAWEQSPQAREVLRPFLHSVYPKERWCSALCLSELGDEQAVPVLCTMLGEFFPENEEFPQGEDQWWYEDRRWFIPRALRRWTFPGVTVALRQALEQQIKAEQYILMAEEILTFMQDVLVYELGYRDAFGILADFPVPAYRLRLTIAHLAIGWYETQTIPTVTYVMGFFTEVIEKRDVRAILNDIVMAKCGLSETEADQCFEKYFDDVIVRLQQAELDAHGRLKRAVEQGEYSENYNIDDLS